MLYYDLFLIYIYDLYIIKYIVSRDIYSCFPIFTAGSSITIIVGGRGPSQRDSLWLASRFFYRFQLNTSLRGASSQMPLRFLSLCWWKEKGMHILMEYFDILSIFNGITLPFCFYLKLQMYVLHHTVKNISNDFLFSFSNI